MESLRENFKTGYLYMTSAILPLQMIPYIIAISYIICKGKLIDVISIRSRSFPSMIPYIIAISNIIYRGKIADVIGITSRSLP